MTLRTCLLSAIVGLASLAPLAPALGPAPVRGQDDAPADAATLEIPYEKFVLDNGLTLIVHEDHKAPIVAVNL